MINIQNPSVLPPSLLTSELDIGTTIPTGTLWRRRREKSEGFCQGFFLLWLGLG